MEEVIEGEIPANNSRIKDLELNREISTFLNKLEHSSLLVNRLDYYGNSIPLGAFCFAVSFILIGFSESRIKVFKNLDKFTYLVLLFFGGIGQITAGIFEYIKSRTFPTVVYILYGLYFLSFFFGKNSGILQNDDSLKIFYGTWAGLTLPLLFASFQTNVFYIIQNIATLAFFIIRCIGECKNSDTLNEIVSGILELIAGFCSLYICFSQVLNEHFRCTILPTFPINKENEIDLK